MAGVSAGPSGGRRRSLDAEINLVPFIDLLSMCICFLLMTAVWIQLGAVQVKQANGTEAAASAAKSLDLDLKMNSASGLQLTVKKGGQSVLKMAVSAANETEFLAKFDKEIQNLNKKYGVGGIAAVMITPQSGVSYGNLVSLMDVLRKNKLVNLGVVPAGGV